MSGSTSRRLAGIVSFTLDGQAWDCAGDVEYSAVTVTRETMKGQTRVEGYSEMPMQGFISANLRDRPDATVFSLNQKTSSTIVIQAANGKTIFAAGAWQVGEIAVRTQEATFTIRFESDTVVETAV